MNALTNTQKRKLTAQLEKWQSELVNLSKRNRLVYFSHTNAGSFEIVEPGMDEVFAKLHRSGWDFMIAEDEIETDDDDSLFEEEATPQKRQPNELRVSNKSLTRLEKDLRLLDSATRQMSLDTGLWILYLGFGMLRWTDEGNEERESPLLLCPVQLTREGRSQRFKLTLAEEDLSINPSLALKLESDFGIALPSSEDLDLTPRAVCEAVTSKVKKMKGKGWLVQDRVVMARFTFHKEAMYRDLVNNVDQLSDHPIVQLIGLGSSPSFDQSSFDYYPDDELEARVIPEDLVSIRDADSTQRRCILAAKDGVSFVMDGPPGTGKSQTIVNIIAELLHDGKSVLFVSEKAAALEVVYKRLAEANLTDFVLELHSHKATRKEVANELGRALEERPKATVRFSASDRQNLINHRKQLTDYAIAMNEVRQPLGHSLHYAIGRVALLHDLPHAPVPQSIDEELSPQGFVVIQEAADRLSKAWGPVERGDDFLWRDLAEQHLSAAREQRVVAMIEEVAATLGQVEREGTDLAAQVGCKQPPSFESASHLRGLVDLVTGYAPRGQVPLGWLTASDLAPIEATIDDRRVLADVALAAREDMIILVGPKWTRVGPLNRAAFEAASGTVASLAYPGTRQQRAAELGSIKATLTRAIEQLNTMSMDAEAVAEAFGVAVSGLSTDRLEALAELACQISATTPPEDQWLNPLSQVALTEAEAVLVPLVENFRDQRERLREVFTDDVLELELDQLRTRLRSPSGLGKLSSSYRADKRLLAGSVVNGKVTKTVIDRLDDAVAWKGLNDQLRRAEQAHASLLGRYYDGPLNTDLDRLDRAVALARRALALSDHVAPDALAKQLGANAEPDPQTLLAGQRLLTALSTWRSFSTDELTPIAHGSLPDDLAQALDWAKELSAALEATIATLDEIEGATGRSINLDSGSHFLEAEETYTAALESLQLTSADDSEALGPDYQLLDSDFDVLRSHLKWAEHVQRANVHPLNESTAQQLIARKSSAHDLADRLKAFGKASGELTDLFVGKWRDSLRNDMAVSFQACRTLLGDLRNTVGEIDEWMRFTSARNDLAEAGLAETVDFLIGERIEAEQVTGSIERATFEACIDAINAADPRLGSLSAADRDNLRRRFQKLDEDLVRSASAAVINACSDRRPKTTIGASGTISREAQKRSRHKPIRQLLEDTWGVAVALKPCFMMSPLTVSRFLPPHVRFDVVIFDEASQVTPADAISSVYRGNQLIVAGDQLQLPPTNFFDAQSESGSEDNEEAPDDFESVLDICKGTTMPELPLRWHYRSQHESLITYSNYRFYEGRLQTFPGAVADRPDLGVELIHAGGVYQRGSGARTNPIEAGVVVDRVLFHRRTHPDLTMGVVAFSVAQQDAILAEIERRTGSEPELRALAFDDRLDGFFVKNLENVQGDDRDIIIFSIGYGPDENGRFTEQLGPLSHSGGHRRLNVAITRARRRVEVVTSVLAEDFPGTSKASGVRHLQRYLAFAEWGVDSLSLDLTDSAGDAESPFEEAVIAAIQEMGFDPVPQVGVAGFRIDIGVKHPERPGEFAVGIECDGAQYHSSRVARDRDRLRQSVLEGLGWTIHRIWGPSWYRDRNSQVKILQQAIDNSFHFSPSQAPRKTKRHLAKVEIAVTDWDAKPKWVVNYRKASWYPGCDVDEASTALLASGAVRIVTEEGPIHHELLLHRMKEAFDRQRLTAQLRGVFEPAITEAKRRSDIERIDQDFFQVSGTTVEVRVPPGGDKNPRMLEQIAPSERRAALKRFVDQSHQVDPDELVRAVARLFGFQRTTEDMSALLKKDLKKLSSLGEIDL